MLRPGRYKAEHDGDIFHAYRYIMEVKETEKLHFQDGGDVQSVRQRSN